MMKKDASPKPLKKDIPARPWHELIFDRHTPIASLRVGGETVPVIPTEMPAIGTRHYLKTLPCGLAVILSRVTHSDYGAVSYLIRLRNDGTSDSPRIDEQFGMDLTLPVGDDARLETLWGDDCNQNSFLPRDEQLPVGTDLTFEPTGGRSSAITGFPWFDIVSGNQTLTFGIGWTGQWRLRVTRERNALRLRASIADADFVLHPGETARMPRLILAANELPLDDNRRLLRRLMRKYYSPATRNGENLCSPLAIQNFDLYFWKEPAWRTESMQLKEIQDAAACRGFDTYWLDAAWFRDGFPSGVGNYECDKGFPNGLKPLSDLAHANKMRFMLWFEPARVYDGSDLVRDHMEFLLSDPSYGDPKNHLFNLGDPTALDWLTKTLGDFIEQNGIDIYREDYNIDPLGFWRRADEPGRAGLTEIKWVEGMYALWDSLRERFPNLLIDNCASGGRRLDLECAARALPCWRSDTGCFPPSEEKPVDLWDQNQSITLSRYLPYQATSSWRTEAYYVRAGMTTGMTMAVPFEDDHYDPAPTMRALDEVNRLRQYWNGDFYAHTAPSLRDDIWCSYQLVLPDGSGCAYAFRRPNCPECSYRIPMQHIDPEDDYRVTITDEQYTTHPPFRCLGRDLQNLAVEADPHESVSVTYQKWIDRD